MPSPSVHIGSIKSFVSNGFTIPDQTQIKGIKKLLPTFWISIKDGHVELKNHWAQEFSFHRRPFKNLESHLDVYEKIYRRGLNDYFEFYQTNELGSLLSGGHDSSFAFIQASKLLKKPIHAFTATFPGWLWNEEKHAQHVCEKNKGIFHKVPFLPEDIDFIVEVIRANEEPVVSVSLPTHNIAREASKYVDTMIGGDGGDTLWGEYYPVAEFHRYIKHMPLLARKGIHKLVSFLKQTTDWERFWELEHVSSLFLEDNYYNQFIRKLCTYRHFPDDFQKKIFSQKFYEADDIPRSILEVPFTPENFRESLIEGKLFNAFYTYMSFFTYRSMENFDLSLYFPTINKELMDFITTLPYEWVNGGSSFHRLTNNKKINRKFHKKALSRYLKRDEIYNRSFDIPWYNILRPRKEVLKRLLTRLKQRGWYNDASLDILFSEFMGQKVKRHELLELKHHGYRVYTLLSLEIWCMEYIDGGFTKNIDSKISLEDYLAI